MKSYADAHCDTVVKAMEAGENMLEFSGQLNLEKLAAYGSAVQIFAIWLEPKYYPIAMRQTVKYLDYYLEQMERYKDRVGMVKRFSDILENKKQGRLSAILSLEGGEALEGEIAALRMYHRLGVRLMTLTWNHRNALADGVAERCTGGGLTTFGKAVVKEMERLGMLADVSHLTDAGFYDVAKMAEQPFVASHSNARAICPHPRNLTDEQLKIIGEMDGFVGLNFFPPFVGEKEAVTQDDLLRQLTHMLDMAGEDTVGLGSDFDGIDVTPTDLRAVEDMALFLERMEQEFGSHLAEKIREKNFLRVAERVWK
ncbi:zn-dependent dipeptidase microsomal dipeptidase [Clostridium sp. CAG:505]|nr:zn-dependent dipeptidase microsomal dipeptidase [Clostridium sp. CAG:505]